MDTVDQPAKGKILLENNKIEEIVANLPDKSSYAPETAQAITTYLQIIDESVATEEILDDEETIFMVQADENEKSIRQEINEYEDIYLQDLYFQNSYSQDPYSQNSYFQDSYPQDPHFQDSDYKNRFSESDSQESDFQESDS
ncbi:hypothetical protein F8M41_025822 [Gigaspora margarita]|uniref:Uncharacterized protein n=1 Tax=Gigaspora margarita TaxID=4874 RepID=A0A8H3XHW1_GIGMA|nr:hypothetical protein F8M41_025822 [Gigaspora margarita]